MSDTISIQLQKLLTQLPEILTSVGYSELYGYDLKTIESIPHGIIIRNRLLAKFLAANKYNVDAAVNQLRSTLEWRKSFNPLSAAFLEKHDPSLKKIGIITSVPRNVSKNNEAFQPQFDDSSSESSSESEDDENDEVSKKKYDSLTSSAAAPEAEDAPIDISGGSTTTKTEASTSKDSAKETAAKLTSEKEDLKTSPTAHVDDVETTASPLTDGHATASSPTTTTTTTPSTTTPAVPAPAATATPTAPATATTSTTATTSILTSTSKTSTLSGSGENAVSPGNIVVTWNLYGRVKNRATVFRNLEAFIRYRVGLMERGIAALDFTKDETSYMAQVHDYNNVSFFRLDSSTKEASKATIDVFSKYYPEFLNLKFFVNVPRLMSWMFTFTKVFLPKATVDKFRVVSNGADLALQTGNFWVPTEYGGTSESLDAISIHEVYPRDKSLVTKYEHKPLYSTPEAAAAASEKATPTTETETTSTATSPPAPEPGAVPVPPSTKAAETADVSDTTKEVKHTGSKVPGPEPGSVPKAPVEDIPSSKVADTLSDTTTTTAAPIITKGEKEDIATTTTTAALKEVEPKTATA